MTTETLVNYLLTGSVAGIVASGILKMLDTILTNFLSRKNKGKDTLDDRVKKLESSQEIVKDAHLAILHDLLYQRCTMYLSRGWCDISEKKNLEYMYLPYKGLGGNGTAETMYCQCQALPTEPEQ